MGRFVVVDLGDFEWEWRFWFAQQCSNFGAVMEMVEGDDVYINRYEGDDGEYVKINADKEKLLEKLKNLKIDKCPVCGNPECTIATREMIKDFIEAVEKYNCKEVYATLFVEYT
jgi:hypothetical protein